MDAHQFHAAVAAVLTAALREHTATLAEIRAAARAALDLTDAYPKIVSVDALAHFVGQYPACANAFGDAA